MLLRKSCIAFFIFNIKLVYGVVPQIISGSNQVRINKCCEKNEVYIDRHCTIVNKSEEWRPLFTSENGKTNLQINFR